MTETGGWLLKNTTRELHHQGNIWGRFSIFIAARYMHRPPSDKPCEGPSLQKRPRQARPGWAGVDGVEAERVAK